MAVFNLPSASRKSVLDGLICSYGVKSWMPIAVHAAKLDEVVAGELDSQFCRTTAFQMSVKSKTAPMAKT